ncbi:Ryanodine receptor Ryr [Thiocystis minor]|uniref:RyR domain-containing protein n=1 Tax=Thiocystis minor TaxID=61597 RepID=UPI001913A6B7|nr:RyR domain-containing protein [Thiocystis minor]MBK5964830.1 Ryanodine receptor Ryr [Thiocystis minor]
MLFGPSPIHVCGSEPLASRVVAGLRADGRRVRLVSPDQLTTLKPARIRTLILADPPDPAGLIAPFAARLDQARRGFGAEPVRLILMHPADPPPPLPTLNLDGRLRLETFAIENRAMRALLARWPLHSGMDPPFGQVPHLLIAGFTPSAGAFLVQALRLIQYADACPRVSVLCDDTERVAARFQAAYPQAGQVAEIRFAPLASPSLKDAPAVTLALVCPDAPGAEGLRVARALIQAIAREQRASPPILLEIGDDAARGDIADWDGQLIPFSSLHAACRPQVLLDGLGDEAARTIHEQYCDSIAAQGRDPGTEPAGEPWPRLATSYRQANRHQADHLWAKLALTDCRAVVEEMVDSFAFTPLEVERLARIEHRRWAADRFLDGWSYAPVRDNARKHHPQLIPYAELSEPMKDLDRFAVRGVPNLLARSGLGVVRLLIVGLPAPGAGSASGRRLCTLTRLVLERLVARYPDRALVLAATLADPATRQVMRQALDQTDAGLFWLLPRPVDELLAAQPDAAARLDLLELAARAERRIALDGEGELARWFAARAEIVIALGAIAPMAEPARRVTLSTGWAGLDWNFEY